MRETGINRVAVIGAGMRGLGIAVEFARFGYQVGCYNTKEESSRKAKEKAKEELNLMTEAELITGNLANAAFKRLRFTTDLKEAASKADYVVESVVEILPVKQQIFATLDELCPPPTILATNTSTLTVTDIAATSKHPERIVATHYFQPPHLIPLVEVVGSKQTSKETVDRTERILRGMRKKAVVIKVELPAFGGNRIQGAVAREAQVLVDKGACTPQMVDDIITFGFGRRMTYTGYFKRLDLVGINSYIERQVARGQQPWPPLAEMMKQGELGMKSGKGFYEWPGDTAKKFLREYNLELIRLLKKDMADGSI